MSADNDWFKDAVAKARRRGRPVEPEPEAEGEPEKKPLDLGQGARGPLHSSSPATMSDVIRGAIAAKRQHVDQEIELERQIRTSRDLLG